MTKDAPGNELVCLQCKQPLTVDQSGAACGDCNTQYKRVNGVIDFWPEKMEETTAANYDYYQETAGHYDSDIAAKEIFNQNAQQRISGILARISRETGGQRLVDLGCGTGNVLNASDGLFKIRHGFDISFNMLAISQKKGFNVFRANVEKLPVPDNSADAVTAFSVLHHLKEQENFFKEAYRILKPGGYLYTDNDPHSLPNRIVRKNFLYRIARNIYQGVFGNKEKTMKDLNVNEETRKKAEYHHNYTDGFTPSLISDALEDTGFSRIDVIPHGNPRSLEKNSFARCPWYFKMYMLLVGLLGFKWSYKKTAPQILILAKK